ncbi:hypothetical protein BCR44DRAFT_128377 [Catenaria anguillulae PL171]|uniref:Ketoreductase domain-containing protein n=1 Tax=Catenaria anguillulae PL171 TaxID=765915 RepID=A0A1Y2HUX9_9FUNG|nr:hypothetical protein BCR44DRAFT_128377 [Catenaria anguillulae PL171]
MAGLNLNTEFIIGSITLCIAVFVATLCVFPGRNRAAINWNTLHVLITGASHGVGRATAEMLLAKAPGLRLTLIDREPLDPGLMQRWKAISAASDERIHVYQHDLADGHCTGGTKAQAASLSSLLNGIIVSHGTPDILINNAGTVAGKFLTDLTSSDIDSTLAINLVAPMLLTQLLLPHWIQRDRGHVIHVASAAGLVGLAWLTDYCASKFALVGFHESLRQELRYTNVHTSVICPGHIKTRLFASVRPVLTWLNPSLTPEQVATTIVRAIERNRSQDVWLPWFTWNALIVRAVPVWLNDFGHWVMSANNFWPEDRAPDYCKRGWEPGNN